MQRVTFKEQRVGYSKWADEGHKRMETEREVISNTIFFRPLSAGKARAPRSQDRQADVSHVGHAPTAEGPPERNTGRDGPARSVIHTDGTANLIEKEETVAKAGTCLP